MQEAGDLWWGGGPCGASRSSERRERMRPAEGRRCNGDPWWLGRPWRVGTFCGIGGAKADGQPDAVNGEGTCETKSVRMVARHPGPPIFCP